MSERIDPEALATYWQGHIDAWRQSGQPQRQFCQANDLSYHRFQYWRRKLDGGGRRATPQAGGGFAQVAYTATPDTGLTLSLPNGLVLRGICAGNLPVVRQLLDQL